ncbi:hypothetical protein [Candidatus Venteria ishoeyi]|uniref:hypothetical protein n=1 Tax=Candidatus Venteria ishoeyi TaxID=1899563 RepID=UPI000CDE6061|nr:hypothetical protein [Candidatus Venteria ishoeyi]
MSNENISNWFRSRFFIFFLRVNLPPNDIANYVEFGQKAGFINYIAANVTLNQKVANWTFTDFILLKMACSERLKTKMIAIPFSKWQLFEKEIEYC